MLNAKKGIRLLHAVVCLDYKATHTLNANLSALSTQSVQMSLLVFSRNVKTLVLEFVVKMHIAKSKLTILDAYAILDFMEIHFHLVEELQVCIALFYLLIENIHFFKILKIITINNHVPHILFQPNDQ